MRQYSCIVAFAVLLIFAAGAFADSMTFSNPGTNIWWNGVLPVYVNPYIAVDNTKADPYSENPPTQLTLFCDDWNTDFSGTPTWNSAIMPLAPPTNPPAAYAAANFLYGGIGSAYDFTDPGNKPKGLTYALDNSPDPYYRYLEAAYLFGQIQNAIALNATDPLQLSSAALATQEQKLSAAAWTLFVDSNHVAQLTTAINNSSFAPDVVQDLAAAASAVGSPSNPNYSWGYGWYVVKPVTGGFYPMQEFLMKPSSNDYSVPEPTTILLLGIVLVGCGRGLARRWS